MARPVTIHRFEVVGPPRGSGTAVDIDVVVECSSGTYIRALARDLGAALGSAGHLRSLRRTAIGAITVDRCSPLGDTMPPVVDIEDVLAGILPVLEVSEDLASGLRHGQKVTLDEPDGLRLVLDPSGRWVCVAAVADGVGQVEVNAPS